MYECVLGMKAHEGASGVAAYRTAAHNCTGFGCILADEMCVLQTAA